VTLNVPGTHADRPRSGARARLTERVLDEVLSWNPREFITAFRRWHRDSFSLIHLNVLMLLEVEGPESMSRLAEALDVSVASMTGIVDRMEKRGLVERRRDPGDRRVVLVHPSDGGLDVFREIDRRRREGLGKLLEQLDEHQLQGLLTGHRALREARVALATSLERTREAPVDNQKDRDIS
jgi:DNA-binding MarR family transcriptional regulator